MAFEFQYLQTLLRSRADAADVVRLIGGDSSIIERNEYYGSVEFKQLGFDLVLQEAPWVLPPSKFTDAKELYVAGFHFHREGHEGYHQYKGDFPGGIEFNDSEGDVRRKLGQPVKTGGGGLIPVLKKPVPRWLRYAMNGAMVHFQLDANGKVEMVALEVENPGK
jgi:hypothetical protein